MKLEFKKFSAVNLTSAKEAQKISRPFVWKERNFSFYFILFLWGLDFLAELDKPNVFDKSLADGDVYFVCATQKT